MRILKKGFSKHGYIIWATAPRPTSVMELGRLAQLSALLCKDRVPHELFIGDETGGHCWREHSYYAGGLTRQIDFSDLEDCVRLLHEDRYIDFPCNGDMAQSRELPLSAVLEWTFPSGTPVTDADRALIRSEIAKQLTYSLT